MKKYFLLITIFLITFGFTFNSNALNKLSNNQNNNIKKTYNTNNDLTTKGSYGSIDTNSLETYPTTKSASISYEISNVSGEIDKIAWRFDDELGIFETFYEETNEPSTDNKGKNTYTGEIMATNLVAGTTYETYLRAEDNSETKYESDYIYVTVPKISKEGEVEQKNNTNVVVIDNDVTLEYTISPAEIDNQVIVPKTITWFNGTEELVSDNINWVEETYDYSLTVKDIPIGEYNDTKLVVTDEENIEYESTIPIDFEIKDIPKESTIEDEGVEVIGQESATINYNVTPGTEGDKIEKISWKWEDNEGNIKTLALIDSTIEDDPIASSGKLQATNLVAGTTYDNTYLELKMIDDEMLYYDNNISSFTTWFVETPGTVSTTVSAKETSAIVTYTIDPAFDKYGEEIIPKKVTWKGEDENGKTFSITEDVTKEDDLYKGNIKKEGLIPGTIYSNKLIIEDETTNPYESSIFSFTTTSGVDKGTITEEELTFEKTTADIKYTIEPAKDTHGVDIPPSNISWVDCNTNEILGDGSAKNIIDKDDIDGEGNYSGVIHAKDLTPDIEYQTKLVVEDKTTITYEKTVSSFTTKPIINEGEVTTSGTTTKPQTTLTSATIDYKISPAENSHGEVINPTKISWVQETNGEVKELGKNPGDASITKPPDDDLKLEDEITAKNLQPYKSYEETYLHVENEDSSTIDSKTIESFTLKTEKETKKGKVTTEALNQDEVTANSAKINYEITPLKDEQGNSIVPTKISWVQQTNSGIEELGKNPGDASNEASQESGLELKGTIEAINLTPATTYDETYLVVEDKQGETYTSIDENIFGIPKEPIDCFTTTIEEKPEKSNGEVENKGIETNGNSATITYQITPAIDNDGNEIDPLKIQWMAKIEGQENDIELSWEKPDSNYGGEMTAINLPTNTVYEETYLVVDDGTRTSYQSEDNFELIINDFKTKKMIIGGSILIISIIISIIVLYFVYGWWRLRNLN